MTWRNARADCRAMVRLAAVLLSALLVTSVARAADGARLDPVIVSTTLARAAALPRLHALIVARDGVPVASLATAFTQPDGNFVVVY